MTWWSDYSLVLLAKLLYELYSWSRCRGDMFSDCTASIMCIAVALTVLLLCTPSVVTSHESIQNVMQMLSSTTEAWLYQDHLLSCLVILFSAQIAIIWLLHAYCDCPNSIWLESKVLTFWLSTICLLICALLSTQLLMIEIIGITSFRLIGHYTNRGWALRGSTIALAVNKITDIIFLGLLTKLYWMHLRGWLAEPLHTDMIVFALSGKSIMLLTWLWLPDAMEGPTPVSTLLHSATLVITGLMIYSHDVHDARMTPLAIMLCIGAVVTCTAYNIEADTKKICATSTCIMIILLWTEAVISPVAVWQQALTHGYYKSSMFCLLGWLLTMCGTQDIRRTSTMKYTGVLLAIMIALSVLAAGWPTTTLKGGSKYYTTEIDDLLLPVQHIGMLLFILTVIWSSCICVAATTRYRHSTTVLVTSSKLPAVTSATVLLESLLSSPSTSSHYSATISVFLLLACHQSMRSSQRLLTIAISPPYSTKLLSPRAAPIAKFHSSSILVSPRHSVMPIFILLHPP